MALGDCEYLDRTLRQNLARLRARTDPGGDVNGDIGDVRPH